MLAFLAAAYVFVCAHGPAIAIFLFAVVPTLITGLSNYPQASGLVSFLRLFLNILSVVSHKDSPGTFKPPLTISKEPEDGGKVVELVPPRGYAPLRTLAFLLAVALAAGCASLFGATGKEDVIDCGKQALAQAASDVLPKVALALSSNSPDWMSALVSLEQDAGSGVVCAVAVLVRDFEKAHQGGQQQALCASNAACPSPDAEAYIRGKQYLADKPPVELPQ